jgi:predicted metal-dependent enzyme (double-stranded beta helix superfamily)
MSIPFETGRFIAECRSALAADPTGRLVAEVVARAASDPAAIFAGLGEPRRGELVTLYRAADLTILNVVLGPDMTIVPHDHRMWAVIGVYAGREDNLFWRRAPAGVAQGLVAAGMKSVCARDTEALRDDVIHSVVNPFSRLTAAIHVYGGDFFGAARSEWDPETLRERPFDAALAVQRFADSNRLT